MITDNCQNHKVAEPVGESGKMSINHENILERISQISAQALDEYQGQESCAEFGEIHALAQDLKNDLSDMAVLIGQALSEADPERHRDFLIDLYCSMDALGFDLSGNHHPTRVDISN